VRALVFVLAASTGLVFGCSPPPSGPGPEEAEVIQRQLDSQTCELASAGDLSVSLNNCSNLQDPPDLMDEVCDGACSGDFWACLEGCKSREGEAICCFEACAACPRED